MKDKKLFASLMLLVATLMWGFAYPIQTLSANYLGSFTIVFFKGISGILLIFLIIKQKIKLKSKSLIKGFIVGFISFLGCIFQQKGMELSTVSKASFITALYIVLVPIIESFLGKKVSKKIWYSIAIALLGLYLLCFSSAFSLQIGDVLLFIGSSMFALQIIMIDSYTKEHDPIVITFASQITVALFASVMMFLYEKPHFVDIQKALLGIIYISVLSGVVATTLQIKYQRLVGASLASLIMSLESVFGALGGWLILNQVLSIQEIFGCILIFIAIILAE